MIKRPSSKETEEDLLRLQQEFLASRYAPSVHVERKQQQAGLGVQSPRQDTAANTDDIIYNDAIEAPKDLVKLKAMEYELMNVPPKLSQFQRQSTDIMTVEDRQDPEEILDRRDTHITALLSKIQEKGETVKTKQNTMSFIGGFPAAPTLDKDIFQFEINKSKKQGTGKSLFARQFMSSNRSAFGQELTDEMAELKTILLKDDSSRNETCPNTITNYEKSFTTMNVDSSQSPSIQQMKSEIHEENLKKMSCMPEQEIMEEQARLKATLDPKLLDFIMRKKKQFPKVLSEHTEDWVKELNSVDLDEIKSGAIDLDPYKEFGISKDIVHMDVVETEKLAWISSPEKGMITTPDGNISARFDLEGNIVPANACIPVNRGLHHHGDQPLSAGYTLAELFSLARANFQQQRILALQVLGRILENNYTGIYVGQVDRDILKSLLDAGLPFLIRWSLDDNTEGLLTSSLFALHNLLVAKADEVGIEYTKFNCAGASASSLRSVYSNEKDNIGDADIRDTRTDAEIIKKDLIKGLNNMQLLSRLRYILEVLKPTSLVKIDCFGIISRFVIHSPEMAYEVFKCPRLMDTIFTQYLPLENVTDTGTNKNEEEELRLRLKVLRLLYHLCMAGRSLARKLWTHYRLDVLVIRQLSEAICSRNPIVLDMASQCLDIWRVCLQYGIELESVRNFHPFLMDFIKKIFFVKSEEQNSNCDYLRATVMVFVAAVMRSLKYSSDATDENGPDSPEYNNQMKEQVTNTDWTLMVSLWDALYRFIKEEFLYIEDSAEEVSLLVWSAMLQYIAVYFECANCQSSISMVDVMHNLEQVFGELIHPWMKSVRFHSVLKNMAPCSLCISNSKVYESAPPSLPNYGYSAINQLVSNPNRTREVFIAVSSTVSCLRRIIEVHKGLIVQAAHIITNEQVLHYLRKLSTSHSTNEVSGKVLASRIEHHLVYNLIEILHLLKSVQDISHDIIRMYHVCGLKLFGLLHPADNHLAFELLRKFLLQEDMMRDCTIAWQKLKTTESQPNKTKGMMTGEQKVVDEEATRMLHSFIAANLDIIKVTYLRTCFQGKDKLLNDESHKFHARGHLVTSFVSAPFYGESQPYDWVFKPIIDLYNETYSMELIGNVISSLTRTAIASVTSALQLILIFEEYRPELFSSIPVATRLARLMCVFLIGSDGFLERPIYNCLQSLLRVYCSQEYIRATDFQKPIPGLTSFSDFFSSLLVQYSSASYGDVIFSNYLILPLLKQHSSMFKKALWSEHRDILRIFSLPLDQIFIEFGHFFDDDPVDFELIELYYQAFLSESLRQNRSPLFYAIAVHHISRYLFSVLLDDKDSTSISVEKHKLIILDCIAQMKDKTKRDDVFYYRNPNCSSSRGFDVFETLPPVRELIISKRKEF